MNNKVKVIYYTNNDGTRGWVQAVDGDAIRDILAKNPNIAEYYITCSENGYESLLGEIDMLKRKIKDVKDFIAKMF